MESLSRQTEPFIVEGEEFSAAEVIEALNDYVNPIRQEKIRRIVSGRSYTVVPVLEGVHDRGNISAVMRSVEALGFQSMHLVESQKLFKKANRITQGADKWLDIVRWKKTQDCVDHLRGKGYRIVVTDVNERAKSLDEVSFNAPTAIFFGNEKTGTSPELVNQADDCVKIPTDGFTQSFNISVAAALTLYHIYHERTRELGRHGDLTEHERECLVASYFMRTIKRPNAILLRTREESKGQQTE